MVRLGRMAMASQGTGDERGTATMTMLIAGVTMTVRVTLRSPEPSSSVGSAVGLSVSRENAAMGLKTLAGDRQRQRAPDAAEKVIVGAATVFRDGDRVDYSAANEGDEEGNSGIGNIMGPHMILNEFETVPAYSYTIRALWWAPAPSVLEMWQVAATQSAAKTRAGALSWGHWAASREANLHTRVEDAHVNGPTNALYVLTMTMNVSMSVGVNLKHVMAIARLQVRMPRVDGPPRCGATWL